MANIYTAIAAIIDECKAIPKSKKNTQGNGYMYRGIDDVMNALQPLFAKYKVFVTPEVIDCQREERQTQKGGNLIYAILKVRYTFYADDGSSVTATVQGEAMDSGDKASNKAMSAAFKYALFQTFCIPTEDFIDTETDSPDVKPISSGLICSQCAAEIKGTAKATAQQIADWNFKNYGRVLCAKCGKAESEKLK